MRTVVPVSPLLAGALLIALVAVATAVGVVQRAREGRVRPTAGAALTPADIGSAEPFGPRGTLVQFSTPTCARCPSTARLLRTVADEHDGVVHVEVDLTEHPDVADRFGVLQTPTTLLLDGRHRVRARIGGAPRRDALDLELQTVLGGDHVH